MKIAHAPLYFTLPFPPSVNGIWRGGKGGRHYLSPRYKAWRTEAAYVARSQNKERVSGPYALQINFVRPDKRRRDLDNLAKGISDLLVLCGFVDDDSECQQIQMKWCEQGPPVWLALRPCKRWALPITDDENEAT